jgi:metal-sulfur cluster biosynthetic enzyme
MKKEDIIDVLKTVYDPEIPILDIYNMGLIYDISVEDNNVDITMTLTTPACPMGDMILEMTKNAIKEKYPQANVSINLSFDPLWNPKMIKDEEIREMFLMQ